MKLSGARELYYFFSGKVSDIVRQMALAGIAIIWVFRDPTQMRVPRELITPAILIVAGITLDLFHYVAGTLVWGIYARRQEKTGRKDDENVSPSARINYPSLLFFWTKIPVVLAAYILILKFLVHRLT